MPRKELQTAEVASADRPSLRSVGRGANWHDFYPRSSHRGALRIDPTDNDSNYTITLTNAAQAGPRTYTIPDAGGDAAFLMGGVTGTNVETLSATKTLVSIDAVFQKLEPNGSNRDVVLPPETTSKGRFFRIVNTETGANDLVVKDDGGSTVATLNQNRAAWFACDGTSWVHMGIETISLS